MHDAHLLTTRRAVALALAAGLLSASATILVMTHLFHDGGLDPIRMLGAHGPGGPHGIGSPDQHGQHGGRTPSGWSHGDRPGWQDRGSPPGWSHGAKDGWKDGTAPPGWAKRDESRVRHRSNDGRSDDSQERKVKDMKEHASDHGRKDEHPR